MNNLNKNTFLTVAALTVKKISIYDYHNLNEWYAWITCSTRKKDFVYVSTKNYKGRTSLSQFMRNAKKLGFEIEYEADNAM